MCDWLKLYLLQSLILSRLCNGAHVVVPTTGYIRTLQTMYMRVLRRIFGESRYQRTQHTDLEVRRKMQQPSIDCLLMRARLRYVKRLVCNSPPALLAILASRVGGEQLPWVKLIVSDLRWLRENSCVQLFWTLPDPTAAPAAWCDQMADPKWGERISRVFFVESVADPPDKRGPAPVGPHACDICGASFPTYRELASHQTTAHKKRKAYNEYIGDTVTCPVCDHSYSSRQHLLKHLYQKQCGVTILNGDYPKAPPQERGRAEQETRELLKQARLQGRRYLLAGDRLQN